MPAGKRHPDQVFQLLSASGHAYLCLGNKMTSRQVPLGALGVGLNVVAVISPHLLLDLSLYRCIHTLGSLGTRRLHYE